MLKNTDVIKVGTAVLLLMFGGNANCCMDKKMVDKEIQTENSRLIRPGNQNKLERL